MATLRKIRCNYLCYRVVICLAVILAAACSNPDVEPPIDESVPADPLFVLLDACKGNEQYFLRYRRGEQIYYAVGDLPVLANAASSTQSDKYDVPLVTSMGRRRGDSWETLTQNLTPVPVLDVQHWAGLRERLFGKLVPRGKNQGVAVSFDRVDYFFFYDKAGNFRARRLIDMPPSF